jgi:hypothetical protein
MDKHGSMATVHGQRADGKNVVFTLSPLEIKHLRRALHLHELLHPPIGGEVVSGEALLQRFRQFGRIIECNSETRQRLRRALPRECTVCGTTQDLTIDHLIRKADGGTNCRENVQTLMNAKTSSGASSKNGANSTNSKGSDKSPRRSILCNQRNYVAKCVGRARAKQRKKFSRRAQRPRHTPRALGKGPYRPASAQGRHRW